MGVSHGSVLGPSLFKPDTFQFLLQFSKAYTWTLNCLLMICIVDESASELNSDLIRMQDLAYQLNMSFNPNGANSAVKAYSIDKQKTSFTLISTLTTCQYLKQYLKNAWH